MYKRILAPIDGSDASQRGVQEAIALALDQRAALQFLYVVHIAVSAGDASAALIGDELLAGWRNNGIALLGKAEQLAADRGMTATTKLVETGERHAAPTIVDEAKKSGCDLIVMGTHGRGGLSHLVLGSEAEGVIRASPVPVLLVRSAA